MKLYSWNINGLRAVLRKNALQDFLAAGSPDILCLQEIKAQPAQLKKELATLGLAMDSPSPQPALSLAIDSPAARPAPDLENPAPPAPYLPLFHPAARPGYSGTAVFTKIRPLSHFDGLLDEVAIKYNWHEDLYGDPLTEGRVQTLEFDQFYLVNVYTPNSKRDLTRLRLRENLWDPAFLEHLQILAKHKPVVTCGDFNAAHAEIDLARPKDNLKNAGFTPEERRGIDRLTAAGFVDTFRALHPADQRYTWWTWRARARERGIGWRIDYFFISESLRPRLRSAEIHESILGSDHCPVSIDLDF